MNKELQNLIEKGKAEVAQDQNHELSFKIRKEILRELGPVINPEDIGIGKFRRANICILAVKRVLKYWEEHYTERHPHRMIAYTEKYLSGENSRETLIAESEGFRGGLDCSDTPDKERAYLVGRASTSAAFVAVDDELLWPTAYTSEKELYDPQDHDVWDCVFWAAGAEAGGLPWMSGFDKLKYRAFWDWYLDVSIPNASLLEL